MPMRTLPAPPQDQSTAMNAATPSIQDFVDGTRLVERRLRTGDTMRCPDCGQAPAERRPACTEATAIRCSCRVWGSPAALRSYPATTNVSGVNAGAAHVTITGWYSSAGIVGTPGPRRALSNAEWCPTPPSAAPTNATSCTVNGRNSGGRRWPTVRRRLSGTNGRRSPTRTTRTCWNNAASRAAPSRARYKAEPPPPRTWTESNAASGAAGRYSSKRSAPSPATT